MLRTFIILLFVYFANSDRYKDELCENLECGSFVKEVCGIREEGNGFKIRLFNNECELLEYGCHVAENMTYGLINLEYCKETFKPEPEMIVTQTEKNIQCPEYDCSYPTDSKTVCGIEQDGNGFRIRLFQTKCQLIKYNCENDRQFNITDLHICNGVKIGEASSDNKRNPIEKSNISTGIRKRKHVIVVDSSFLTMINNINETIDNFFAATHVLDLPLVDVRDSMNETSRRMLMKVLGPVSVFKPWVNIPKNVSTDHFHAPTLTTCFHKCPLKCPDVYKPVCGVPGTLALEPVLMFKNHCFMDLAQCKAYWENKSRTARYVAYIESSFVFCLGDELNSLHRLLPFLKTLKRMGRLRQKGIFRYKIRNMRFFNNYLSREPKIMG